MTVATSAISVSRLLNLSTCSLCRSLFQTEEWSVDRVCSWLDAVATVQNSGKSAHPDDLRAGILPLTHTHTKCTFSLSLSLSLISSANC